MILLFLEGKFHFWDPLLVVLSEHSKKKVRFDSFGQVWSVSIGHSTGVSNCNQVFVVNQIVKYSTQIAIQINGSVSKAEFDYGNTDWPKLNVLMMFKMKTFIELFMV